MSEISGRNALITGGTSGIGRLMALKMASLGANVAVYGRSGERLEAITDEIRRDTGGVARGFVCDVSDRERVYEAAGEVDAALGPVDILVNNAGVVFGKRLLELADEEIEATMAANVLGLYWVTRSILPQMISGGHIATIASVAGMVGVSKQTDYSASKHAARGFAESLRMELARDGRHEIKTTLVNPYFVDTGMFEGVKTPFPRLLPILKPEDVANRAVEAIARDKTELTMPPLARLLPALRILPTPLFDRVVERFGVNSSMEDFAGRK